MSYVKRSVVVWAGLTAAVLTAASPSTASAATVSVSVGPIPLPDVPIEICINDTCITTPELSEVSLTATASANGLALPTITPGVCPSGQIGVVLNVGSVLPSNVTIELGISGELPVGDPFDTSLGPITLPLSLVQSATISACVEP